MDALEPGTVIDGRFELERVLGSGAFGHVWAANDKSRGGRVAIKFLRPSAQTKTSLLERFGREFQLLENLEHPNIVRSVAADLSGDIFYFAMELAPGATLKQEMFSRAREGRAFAPTELSRLADQVCSALGAVHELGVIHRDLKPTNIMVEVGPDGLETARVLDFGIAKIPLPGSDQTTAGRTLGTPMYMAPEQIVAVDIDGRADVFALGVVLFEAVTLRRPFALAADGGLWAIADGAITFEDANARPEVIRRIVFGPRPRASAYRKDLPPAVEQVLIDAMAVDQTQRIESVAALAIAFREAWSSNTSLSSKSVDRRRAETALAGGSENPVPWTQVAPRPLTQPVELTRPNDDQTKSVERESAEPITTIAEPRKVSSSVVQPPRQRRLFELFGALAIIGGVMIGFLLYPSKSPEKVETRVIVQPAQKKRPTALARPPTSEQPAPPSAEPKVPSKNTKGRNPLRKVSPERPRLPESPPPEPTPKANPFAFEENSPSSIVAASRKLERAARALPKGSARTTILRCAALSGIRASAKELRACVARFERVSP